MMDQISKLLEDYRQRGGICEEVSIGGAGHVVFMSHPKAFNRAFHAFLEKYS